MVTHLAPPSGQGAPPLKAGAPEVWSEPSPVACFAVLVDAKDETAARFYELHGYIRFTSRPLTLFLAGPPKVLAVARLARDQRGLLVERHVGAPLGSGGSGLGKLPTSSLDPAKSCNRFRQVFLTMNGTQWT